MSNSGHATALGWRVQLARLYLAMLLLTAAGVWGFAQSMSSDAPSDPNAVHLQKAKTLFRPDYSNQVPDSNDPAWRAVNLPHRTDRESDARYGYQWYLFEVETPPNTWQDAIYIPRVSMNAEVYVDHARVGYFGNLVGDLAERNWNRPLLVSSEATLQQPGRHTIAIQVRVYGRYFSGLTSIWVGNDDAIRKAHASRTFNQIHLVAASTAMMVAAALGYLMLWAFPATRQPILLWLVVGGAFWCLRNYSFLVAVPPVHYDLWLRLVQVSLMAFYVLIFQMIHRYCNLAHFKWERGFLNACSLSLPIIFVLPTEGVSWMVKFYGAIGLTGSLWAAWLLLKHGNQHHRPSDHAFAYGMVLLTIFSLNDMLVFVDQLPFDWYFLNQHLGLVMFVASAYLVASNYAHMLEERTQFGIQLQQRLVAQQKELELKHQALQSQRLAQLQLDERQRLMADMHDGLGAHLVAAIHQANNPQASKAQLVDTLNAALRDLQLNIDSLEPIDHDVGVLVGAFRYRIMPSLQAAGIQLHWHVDGPLPPLQWLTPKLGLSLLRLLQEVFSNILKHAKASQIRFELNVADANTLSLVVADNGLGIDDGVINADLRAGKGRGNIERRAKELGAELQIQSAQNKGTAVKLLIPIVNSNR